MTRLIVLTVFAAGCVLVGEGQGESAELQLPAQKRTTTVETITVTNPDGTIELQKRSVSRVTPFMARLDPARTAVIVCDMWDDHWCKSAAIRCGELAKAADPVLAACRQKGMTIIHAPSDCMDFYKDHPARKRMLAVKPVAPPKSKDLPNPPLPVDDSDGGCDDEKPAKQFKAWSRQHPAITIDADRDYISDSGTEVFSLTADKGITTLLVLGVHTNMCVLNRTFAIKQMVKWGKEVFLVRDLTDAMYNPKMKPFVTHQQGTDLIIAFIEEHWCPTIESKALTGAK
jgi:nicotinamidase-related amidase